MRCSVIFEQMEPLAATIREAGIESVAGLRAKALVAMWDCWPMFAIHDGQLCFEDERSHQSLFEGAISLAGLSGFCGDVLRNLRQEVSDMQVDSEPLVSNPGSS